MDELKDKCIRFDWAIRHLLRQKENYGVLEEGLTVSSKTISTTSSWVDSFAGKWQDNRPTSQIISDIHTARTSNSEISL